MQQDYFATVAAGLEDLAVAELRALGAQDLQSVYAGVSFRGDRALLYRVNLAARYLFRVLVPLTTVRATDADRLYDGVYQFDWSPYLDPDRTLAIHCTGSNRRLNHSHFTALQVKNAIVDQQRDRQGRRSSVDPHRPDLAIHAHIEGDRCTLSLDSSGDSLHRRGYRAAMGAAPLKETLAAALIAMTEWEPGLALCDPLCGSGTLVLEAALKDRQIAPGLFREEFALERWRDFDGDLWQKVRQDLIAQEKRELSAWMGGSDADPEIVHQAQINAEACHLGDQIAFTCQSLHQVTAPSDRGIIICNPPYGKRIGAGEELGELYKQLGDLFKQQFKGWVGYILTGDKELAKRVGLKASRRIPINNGGIPCTLLRYELY